ncbi:hypothetical protein [Actinomadura parmotrematis]|uniref:Right-handed parallel beta-helix repeat-containing protein n=1 Tax=Actinomadura parmotrematis TaxID=2864039 RepID=A0ABS7FQC9_9ACTN|nr:hypothetical protein [Actinomadura parmotrematis]MBW8482516.1 hypothetical protein [Actinomadura parmotrematis]
MSIAVDVRVASVAELVEVLERGGPPAEVQVAGTLEGVPPLTLPPGWALAGRPEAELVFAPGGDGIRLTGGNRLARLRLETAPDRAAVSADTSAADLGTVELADLTVAGRVEIAAEGALRTGHVVVSGLHLEAADARAAGPRPAGYGVEVLPGAFTLHNRQPDEGSLLTADLSRITAGAPHAPVRGSGVFVSGTRDGGRVEAVRLRTGEIHSDGGLAPGTADRITAGVFVGHGAEVREVLTEGPVTTYGANDMVLDLWGRADVWTATAPLTSHGASGIGFVNFGDIGRLRVTAPIETHGTGARGFNLYDGTIDIIEFDRIRTHGDAAVGIQLSRPFGALTVFNGVRTSGGTGDSLVKGEIRKLPATGISLLPGTAGGAVRVNGGVLVDADGVPALDVRGTVADIAVTGGVGRAAPATGREAARERDRP